MAKACYVEALELCNRLQSDHPIVASIHSRLSRMRANDKTRPQSESAVKSEPESVSAAATVSGITSSQSETSEPAEPEGEAASPALTASYFTSSSQLGKN